jgi:sugar lactone lactonase YvrE
VTQPTSVIFAGAALDVLVITSASRHLSADEQAAQPLAGGVFCCRPGTRGLPTHACTAVAPGAGDRAR